MWAAVEIMEWGMFSHLYGMAPSRVDTEIAGERFPVRVGESIVSPKKFV